jgi:hypothetical protein
MWQQYRLTFVPTQIFILAACVTVYFTTGRQGLLAGMVFAVMQVSFVLSAAWTARVVARRGRRMKTDGELPLQRRRQ